MKLRTDDLKIHKIQGEIKDIEWRIKGHRDAIIKREKELAVKKRVLERLMKKSLGVL